MAKRRRKYEFIDSKKSIDYRDRAALHVEHHKSYGYKTCSEVGSSECDVDAKAMLKKHREWLLENEGSEEELAKIEEEIANWLPMSKREGFSKPQIRYIKHSDRTRRATIWGRH